MADEVKLTNLIYQMQSVSVTDRVAAARELGKYRDPLAVQTLMRACDDRDPTVRGYAAAGLRAGGTAEGMAFLQARGPQTVSSQTVSSRTASLGASGAAKARARKKMIIGGLFLVGGVLATAIGYSVVSGRPEGGTYIVFSGAILFGLIDLVVGACQYLKS